MKLTCIVISLLAIIVSQHTRSKPATQAHVLRYIYMYVLVPTFSISIALGLGVHVEVHPQGEAHSSAVATVLDRICRCLISILAALVYW